MNTINRDSPRRPTAELCPLVSWSVSSVIRVVAVLLSASSVSSALASDVDFQRDVAPIFQEHCVRCHNAGNNKGDFSLATAAELRESGYVEPGEPDGSYLLEVVRPDDDGNPPLMPKEGEHLTAKAVAVLEQWIEQGAAWPEGVTIREAAKADGSWWSLQPLADVQLPEVDAAPERWQKSPIDRLVFQQLDQRGLRPSPRADRSTLIRRATYDLTGLPPTPEQVADFIADDSPQAYERLVERLLDSPHYGEHWGRHWLDVVRFGESRGFERNEIINNAWPFRDYVIESLNADKPFDQFIREHLAGDVLGDGKPPAAFGTTFLVGGPYDDVGNQDAAQAAQIRANTIDEVIRATSEAFLGLTIGCARCHDHKFDPVLQQDYYALYSTFAGVHHASRVLATSDEIRERDERLQPLNAERDRLRREIASVEEQVLKGAEERIAELEGRWQRPRLSRQMTEETFPPIKARFVRLVVEGTQANPSARSGYRIDEFEVWTDDAQPRNVALAAHGGSAEGSSRVANDFAGAYSAALTIDGKFGARWIASGSQLKITFAEPNTIRRVVFSSDRNGDAGDHSVAAFVSEYRIEVSLDGQEWTEVANSHDRQPINAAHRRKRLLDATLSDEHRRQIAQLKQELGSVEREIRGIPAPPSWWVGQFKPQTQAFHVFLGGDPQKPGPEVVPASLSVLGEVVAPYALDAQAAEPDRRLALADWLVAAEHPLTRRVLANRIWHYHFGTGIVDTPSDFGYMGGRPTHPELLDWLAAELGRHGWRIKPLHRAIMLSETYRQASTFNEQAAAADADARYLWRFPPRRLSAEEIRDTLLAISGELNRQAGGPGFRLYRYLQDNVATYVPLDQHGPETYRRSVYHQNARASHIDLMTDFDCPDNAFAAPRRASTTTPLQALTLLNHDFSTTMARALAQRVRNERPDNIADQVRRTFWLAYSRDASGKELEAAVDLAQRHGLRALCRAIINSNELIYLQ